MCESEGGNSRRQYRMLGIESRKKRNDKISYQPESEDLVLTKEEKA